MLGRFSPAELIRFARRVDPGLEGRDFADAGLRLDQLPDQAFAVIGLSEQGIAAVRGRFTTWPRTPAAADRELADPPDAHPPVRRFDPGREDPQVG